MATLPQPLLTALPRLSPTARAFDDRRAAPDCREDRMIALPQPFLSFAERV